jgi:hypothetical protein
MVVQEAGRPRPLSERRRNSEREHDKLIKDI